MIVSSIDILVRQTADQTRAMPYAQRPNFLGASFTYAAYTARLLFRTSTTTGRSSMGKGAAKSRLPRLLAPAEGKYWRTAPKPIFGPTTVGLLQIRLFLPLSSAFLSPAACQTPAS